MLIEKVLNNNVVVTRDDQNREIVVMGRGLAFKKIVGDPVEPTAIDKVFQLANGGFSRQFQELIKDVPLEYFETAAEIIAYTKQQLHVSLNESIYISLTDHLHTAIERQKNGITVPNVLLWDIKQLFPDEFAIVKKTVEQVSKRYNIQLSENEAGFIALHLVNAQSEQEEMTDMYTFTKTMQDILNIVRYHFGLSFEEESVYFYRFTTHLRFFLTRVLNHEEVQKSEVEEELLEIVQKKYPNAKNCVGKIAQFLQERFDYTISQDELMYLTIHIARLVQRV
ncbi:MAG: PRD domain-containing protein [Enterococcus lacertideformus]|uniref:PRD domain-containing protein n=1 Tax=Enterococcus lacertideformus TaxID=2771493 RepID=A0A931AZN5_9ENTE|nr:PRD domain-containing protein [Enterococcus lacertideformus]